MSAQVGLLLWPLLAHRAQIANCWRGKLLPVARPRSLQARSKAMAPQLSLSRVACRVEEGGVGVLALSRPAQSNAMDREMWTQIPQVGRHIVGATCCEPSDRAFTGMACQSVPQLCPHKASWLAAHLQGLRWLEEQGARVVGAGRHSRTGASGARVDRGQPGAA